MPGKLAVILLDLVVIVPRLTGTVPQLHHAHPAFDQTSSDEQLSPLGCLAIALSDRRRLLLELEGIGHTAIIHSKDEQRIQSFALAMPASRILANSPGSQGVVGLTTELPPSLTLGCGTFGGTSTTDNVTYTHLTNVKRLAEFVPPTIDV